MNEIRKLMEALEKIDEQGSWVDPPKVGDKFVHTDSGIVMTVIKVGGTHVILLDEEDGQEVEESFVDDLDGLYSDAYSPVVEENYYGGGHLSTDVRQVTNKLHELMDEGLLDPRAVADAALNYLSESDVADMARTNELIYDSDDDDDDMEESVEVVGEAYDEEVSGKVEFRDSADMTKAMLRDLQKLERNTSRVYREAQQSQRRKDFPQMLINELGETLHEITNLVEKYEEASVSTPGRYDD